MGQAYINSAQMNADTAPPQIVSITSDLKSIVGNDIIFDVTINSTDGNISLGNVSGPLEYNYAVTNSGNSPQDDQFDFDLNISETYSLQVSGDNNANELYLHVKVRDAAGNISGVTTQLIHGNNFAPGTPTPTSTATSTHTPTVTQALTATPQATATVVSPSAIPLRIDFNSDNIIDISDFIEFVKGYQNGDCKVDLNTDNNCDQDIADFIEFVKIYVSESN